MRSDFEATLLESGRSIRRGALTLIENAGKTTAVITVAVTALLLFTNIGFTRLGAESFTPTLAVMLLSSYLIYFSMHDAGEGAGARCAEYKNAHAAWQAVAEKIGGSKIGELRKFCKQYAEAELEYRRDTLLLHHGYGKDEYEEYRQGKPTSRKQRRIFKAANKIKAVEINPGDLLSKEARRRRSELVNPYGRKLLGMLLRLIPTTLGTTLTVSVMLSLKENLRVADVIDGIFKLSSLLVIGFRGYCDGYCYVKHSLTAWLITKARLLSAFADVEK